MADPQRNPKLLLNFDSLTDTVTNLAGALILLVVLILGVTGQGGNQAEPLLEQVERLRLEIRAVDQEIQQLEANLPPLQRRVERLQQKSKAD